MLVLLLQVTLVALGKASSSHENSNNLTNNNIMANDKFYCEYCGNEYSSVRTLTSCKCPKHPDGSNKGYHKLYEGSIKSKYTCKYCGNQYSSIRTLTSCTCPRHPNGRGYHSPAL